MLIHTIIFRVAGITFKNEEGKDIQKEIKRVLNEYKKNKYFNELYGGYTNSEIKELDLNISEFDGCDFIARLEGDEYEGADCFKIYLKTYNDSYLHIGYAPKEYVNEITEWVTKENIKIKGTANIVGGKYKYCEQYEEDYEEKEKVSIKELAYGAEITLFFYDDNPEPNYNDKNDYHKSIDKKEENKKKNSKFYEKWWFWVIVVVAVVGITGTSSENETKNTSANAKNDTNSQIISDNSNSEDDKIAAYVMSQDFIKDYLTSPSTAKFPSYPKINVIQTNNRYKVEAYVESENNFGATVKTEYYMILEKADDGGWIKVSCDLK